LFSLSLGLALTVICFVFSGQIVSVFLTDPTAYTYAVHFVHILLTTSFLFGVYYVLTNALQAMGAAAASFVINVSRQGLIFIPAMYLLEAAMGITGLVWAQPAADVLSFGLALILYVHTWRKLSQSKTETTAPAAAAEKMSAVCE